MKQEVWKFDRDGHLRMSRSLFADIPAVARTEYGLVFEGHTIGGVVTCIQGMPTRNLEKAKLFVARVIQRQLREKGVECVIRDSKTGEVL